MKLTESVGGYNRMGYIYNISITPAESKIFLETEGYDVLYDTESGIRAITMVLKADLEVGKVYDINFGAVEYYAVLNKIDEGDLGFRYLLVKCKKNRETEDYIREFEEYNDDSNIIHCSFSERFGFSIEDFKKKYGYSSVVYKIYYGNDDMDWENKELVGQTMTFRDSFGFIEKYIKDHNLGKCYYFGVNDFGDTKVIDYGSHTKFFYVCGKTILPNPKRALSYHMENFKLENMWHNIITERKLP